MLELFPADNTTEHRGIMDAVELPVEFSLGEGEAAPVRAVLQQAAAGELSLSQAKELLPMAQQAEKALAAQAKQPHPPRGFYNAYLHGLLQKSG